MIIEISEEAELDLEDGYWFYEHQEIGVGITSDPALVRTSTPSHTWWFARNRRWISPHGLQNFPVQRLLSNDR